MKWILIIFITNHGVYGTGAGVGVAEFNTKEACVDARLGINKLNPSGTLSAKCFKKGFTG